MSIIEKFLEKAKSIGKTIVLPEGHDPRVVTAASKAIEAGIAKVIVLGTDEEIANSAKEAGVSEINFDVINPATSDLLAGYAEEFCEMRKKKGISLEQATETMKGRIFFGAMMCRKGDADGLVAGSIASTGDMLRAAFTVVGTAPGISTGSSSFIMDLATPSPAGDSVLLFADCAVNPDPTAEQLVDIAIASADTYRALVGEQPKVAFLAFSSYGSASHPSLNKIKEAAKLAEAKVKAENLDILIDANELQADSAIVPAVAASKCPTSPLEGKANVLVFPDLNSGNICYKITQRLAGAGAFGPVLQGLAKPVNDLSRGCSADDIYGLIAITACQAN